MYIQGQSEYALAPALTGSRCNGLGCTECGGTCGGLGLFDTGMDWTQWGWQEYLTVAFGGYVLFSLFSTTSRGVASVRKVAGRRRRARNIRERLS